MNDDLIYARVVNTVHINGQDVEYEAVSEEKTAGRMPPCS